MTGGRKLAHVQSDLGEHDLGGFGTDAGNLVEPGDRGQRPSTRRGGGVVVGAAVGGWLRGGDLGDEPVDPGGEVLDLGAECVDLVQQQAGQFGVVVIEASGRAWTRAARLTRIRPRASSASSVGSRCPAMSASIIARPETPMMSVATVESLIRASSRSFSSRCTCRERSWSRSNRNRV
jgi:hypothetical protein